MPQWKELIVIRDKCNISIEEKRANKEIGSSLEADLIINLNSKFKNIIKDIDFAELCITSKASINFFNENDVVVKTSKAQGTKCPVCWKISNTGCDRHS